jgi:two-component system, OmpR family, phosphate regulon sensor histidine kinase PhoR
MGSHTQAIVLNGVPLVILSALYLGTAAALAPIAWREWRRATALELAFLCLFPLIGVLTALFAVVVLVDRKPFGGHVWFGLATIAIAAFPPVAVLVRWKERRRLIEGWLRSRETDERVAFVDRELDSVAAVSTELGRARDAESVARALAAQVGSLPSVDVTVLALVDQRAREASGVLAFAGGRELDWAPQLRLDLDANRSAIARAVSQRAPVVVEEGESSPSIDPELMELTGVKSAIVVPLVAGKRVTGVVVAGTTKKGRSFSGDELALLQAVAAEGGLALDRVRSSEELADALDRERLVARIARKVRSELDLDAVLDVAVSEMGRALGLSRCFIRLGRPGGPMPVEAEWDAEGVQPVGERAERLPASNLAAMKGETVAITNVASAGELDDPALGGRQTLLQIGTHAVLATPIVVFDRMIGIIALHRAEPSAWPPQEVKLAEAVAREVGLAVHTARLLRENEERLEHLSALIKAAQVVSAELRLETVLQRLVAELANLLQADAADCYLREPDRGTLRCAAVHGLDPHLVGFESPEGLGLVGRALEGRGPVVSHEYDDLPQAFPNPAYDGFAAALVAPMTSGGEVSGVLGVGTRDPARRFSRADRETIEAFAGLAALALRNAASFEERMRRARVERGFYLVASALAQPLSRAETLDALAQAAAEALGGDCAGVVMPQAGELRLGGRHGLSDPLEDALGELPAAVAEASRRGLVLAAPDVLADSRFEGDWSKLARGSFRSLLAIPVEGEEQRGVVTVFFAEQRSFTDDDLELARHLADAAKGALERSELFERERNARALSQQLARVGTFLATELDPNKVMSEVVAEAPALLSAEASTIRVVEGEELVVRVGAGRGAEAMVGSRTPSTTGHAGEVAQSRAPVAVSGEGEQRSTDADGMLAAGYGSYLGVPLSGPEGGVLGVLSVYARGARRWRDDEIEALVALAANASAALSNAELYQRIALEKDRSDAILAHVADGIVAVDREGRVVLWNEAASQITGIDRAEAIGRDPADVLKHSLAAPEGYEVSASRILSIPRGGENVWLSVSEAVMRDPAGVVAGRIYAFRDISAERLVEQMKSDFVFTVSHQLRAPLTSIYGFAETLLRYDVDFTEDERRTFLQYVASESERLTAIVDTLLNVARLEAGDLQVKLAPIDLHSLLEEVVSTTELPASVNGHELVLELPDEPLAAEADDEKLRQVLANLLDNAVKFSPEGGRVTVSARRNPDTGTVEVAVADEGMGIRQAEHQLIFSKFYRRANSTGQEGMGAGLGLFIAEGLVSAMGGSMRVSSVEGRGSSFVFELPLAGDADAFGSLSRPKEASQS